MNILLKTWPTNKINVRARNLTDELNLTPRPTRNSREVVQLLVVAVDQLHVLELLEQQLLLDFSAEVYQAVQLDVLRND